MVLKKSKPDNKTLFIDATGECVKVTNNKLTEANISRIVDVFAREQTLRMRNLLASFDDFTGNELISERDMQDYLGCRTSVCHGCGKHPVERWMRDRKMIKRYRSC